MELLQGGAIRAAREFRALLIALNQRPLDRVLCRARDAGVDREQNQYRQLHSTSAARLARMEAANSRTAFASTTRSSIERMMVGAARTSRPSERTPST